VFFELQAAAHDPQAARWEHGKYTMLAAASLQMTHLEAAIIKRERNKYESIRW
jgi:hypothetical protein